MSDHSPAFESPAFESPDFPEAGRDLDEDLDQAGAGSGSGREVDADAPAGGRPRAVLDHIARSLVDEPDAVEVDVSEARNGTVLSLRVAPGDMGRVIGKRGRIAQALRTVVRAAGARDGTEASVDIVD